MTLTRRSFLGTTGLAGVALTGARALDAKGPAQAPAELRRPVGDAGHVARDEAYWRRAAAFLGATPGEVLLTRGATEALQRLIVQ